MKKNNQSSSSNGADAPKKKKITFPKVMLILAIAIAVGWGGFAIIQKLNESVAKSVNIEAAYSEVYLGNPQYESVEFSVSVYPETANQAYRVATSDANIASVTITEEGKVRITAVGVGRATITVQSVAKASLIDSCVIDVKNTDVQDVTFIELIQPEIGDVLDEVNAEASGDNQETLQPIEKEIANVVMQKDGLEHYVYFKLNPLDANMDNLTVDFDENILESVTIDKQNRRLVVVPKTDIANASTAVYMEINQNTDSGERVVSKNVRIQINLVEREAYLAFEFASETNDRKFSSNHSGFVYLDPKNLSDPIDKRDISDFFVKVVMAYDKNFETFGEFRMEDFVVKVNDEIIIPQGSEARTFYYTKAKVNPMTGDEEEVKILEISKIYDNGDWFYKVTATTDFEEEKYCRLTFEHFYTGAQGVVEVSFFDQQRLSEDKNKFNLAVDETSKAGQTINFISSTNSAYAISKGSETVMFTTYDAAINAGIIKAFPVDAEGNECFVFTNNSGEKITITQVANRMKLSASSTVFNTQNKHDAITISFRWKYTYWDNRYIANYGEEQKIDVNFYIEGIYFNANDDNVNTIQLSKSTSTTVNIYSTLDEILKSNAQSYQSYFNQSDITCTIEKDSGDGLVESTELVVTLVPNSNGGFWSFLINSSGATSGEYVVTFSYCDMKIVINATLP